MMAETRASGRATVMRTGSGISSADSSPTTKAPKAASTGNPNFATNLRAVSESSTFANAERGCRALETAQVETRTGRGHGDVGAIAQWADRYEPDELTYSLWIPQVVHEMLLTVGGYRDDYQPSESNEMVWHPQDLALEWDRLWHEVIYAEEETLLTKCAHEERLHPNHYHPSPMYRFLNLARCLQESQGEEPIMLPQFPVAEVIGTSQTVVSHLTKRAIRERFLIRVADASFNKRRAARFRFVDRPTP